mgnify:FL=1
MEESQTVSEPKKKWPLWKKVSLGIVAVLLLAVISASVYAFTLYNQAKQMVEKDMHQRVTNIDPKVVKEKVSDKEPVNILLLGVDKRSGDRGRSDALIVMTLDPKKEKMLLVSIPRDTRTEIVGRGHEDKINHAYAFGGADMSIATVEHMLNIDLDYYVEINMEGLKDLVDLVGGVTVHNELDWTDESRNFHYAPGELNLNGDQALGYVRMRYEDPQGDFGRTKRQRDVIEGIIHKGKSIAAIGKISDVMDILGANMATNMDMEDMRNLLLDYRSAAKQTEEYMLQGSGSKINGIYYYIVPYEEIEKVQQMIASVGEV